MIRLAECVRKGCGDVYRVGLEMPLNPHILTASSLGLEDKNTESSVGIGVLAWVLPEEINTIRVVFSHILN